MRLRRAESQESLESSAWHCALEMGRGAECSLDRAESQESLVSSAWHCALERGMGAECSLDPHAPLSGVRNGLPPFLPARPGGASVEDDAVRQLNVRILTGNRPAGSGHHGGGSASQRERVLHVEVTDEAEPYFLFTLDVGEVRAE